MHHNTDQDLFDDLIVSTHFHEDAPVPIINSNESLEDEPPIPYYSPFKCTNLDEWQTFGISSYCWPQKSPTVLEQVKHEEQENNYSLVQKLKEEEELRILMEQDSCMIFEYSQKYVLLDLPLDNLVQILEYLTMQEVIKITRTCKQFRHITKNDVLWEKYYTNRFIYSTDASYDAIDDDMESLIPNARPRRNSSSRSGSRLRELKERGKQGKATFRRKKEKPPEQERRVSLSTHDQYHFYSLYKSKIEEIKRKKLQCEKLRQEEELRKHYEKVLRQPQRWTERAYFLYTPFFFLASFASALCMALLLDGFIEQTTWRLVLILAPYLFLVVPLYCVASIAAVFSDYLRMLRWNSPFDSVVSMIYLGNLWLPLLSYLIPLKQYILPHETPWRAAVAPQWVASLIYIVLSLVVHKKVARVKFEVDQKVIAAGTCFLNLAVSMTLGFTSAKLDYSLQDSLQYSTFVFFPIWLVFIVALIAVPVGAYLFLHEEGLKPTLFIYFPLVLTFIVPLLPFFVLMALHLDGIVQTYYVVIMGPLYFWLFVWFIITSIGVIILERGRSPSS